MESRIIMNYWKVIKIVAQKYSPETHWRTSHWTTNPYLIGNLCVSTETFADFFKFVNILQILTDF